MEVGALYYHLVEAQLVQLWQPVDDELVDPVVYLLGYMPLHYLHIVVQVRYYYAFPAAAQNPSSHLLVALVIAQRAVYAESIDGNFADFVQAELLQLLSQPPQYLRMVLFPYAPQQSTELVLVPDVDFVSGEVGKALYHLVDDCLAEDADVLLNHAFQPRQYAMQALLLRTL